MSDHRSDKRLDDLAALRDRGVLSEEEFQRAKQRLLEGRTPSRPAEPSPRRLFPHWLVFTLAGLAVLVLLLWLVVMRGGRETETNTTAIDDLNQTAAPLPGPELCSSDAIYGQIVDAAFNRAVQNYAGDPRPLASLRRAVGIRMQYPVLRDFDAMIERTDCSGRLVVDIPPDAQDEFGGVAALQADVIYSIQPSADGRSALVELDGTEVIVQRLIAAATLLSEVQAGQRTYDPSFDCGGTLSDVERMICRDEELSRRDRALSERYRQLQAGLPPAEQDRLAAGRRRFLESRSNCADRACLAAAYEEWQASLGEWAGGQNGLTAP